VDISSFMLVYGEGGQERSTPLFFEIMGKHSKSGNKVDKEADVLTFASQLFLFSVICLSCLELCAEGN